MRFDHALIAVRDLAAAKQTFEAEGFTVLYGGAHSSGFTHNALITFADGSYLELIAPTDPGLLEHRPELGPGNYLFLFDSGEGFAGYALDTDDLEQVVNRIRERGLEIGDPQVGGRRRVDGVELRWRTAFLPGSTAPFFLTDDTPREHRVRREPEITTHSNGVTGAIRIVLAVKDLEHAIRRHIAILDTPALPGSAAPGALTADFDLGNFTVTLAAPKDHNRSVAEFLSRRGEVPYLIQLVTVRANRVGMLALHGARIELVRG